MVNLEVASSSGVVWPLVVAIFIPWTILVGAWVYVVTKYVKNLESLTAAQRRHMLETRRQRHIRVQSEVDAALRDKDGRSRERRIYGADYGPSRADGTRGHGSARHRAGKGKGLGRHV